MVFPKLTLRGTLIHTLNHYEFSFVLAEKNNIQKMVRKV
jgi:hypothetical protein